MKPTSAAASRRTSSALDWAQSTRRVAPPTLCTVSHRCRNSAPASADPTPGKRQAHGTGPPPESSSCGAAAAAFGSASSAATSASLAPGRSSESSFSSRQERPRPPPLSEQADVAPRPLHGLCRAVAGGVVEDENLVLDPGRVGALDRGQAGEQVLAAIRVHDAVGERGCQAGHDNRAALEVHIAVHPEKPVESGKAKAIR